MLKQTLNKGISTPIAISIILILVILVGSFTWWQYTEIQDDGFKPIEIFKKKSTCTQDAASNYRGEGEDPCDRSCQSDEDCKEECGCECISKEEKCKYTGIACEPPHPDYGCKCIDNTCSYEYIGEDETADWETPTFVIENSEDLMGKEVSVKGTAKFGEIGGCTEEYCPPGSGCCNSCDVQLILESEGESIVLSGRYNNKVVSCWVYQDCSQSCYPLELDKSYIVTGTWDGRSLDLISYTLID